MIFHPGRTGSCIMRPRRAVSCLLKLNPPARIGKKICFCLGLDGTRGASSRRRSNNRYRPPPAVVQDLLQPGVPNKPVVGVLVVRGVGWRSSRL